MLVAGVRAAIVPKAVGNDDFSLGSLAEDKAVGEILRKGDRQIVRLKSMEGDVDLVQRRGSEKYGLHFVQKCSVGGEDHLETGIAGKFKEQLQLRMAEGFAHEVEI